MLESKEEDLGYPKDLFDNLIYRYEEPNGMTRWDSPLFTVPFDDETPPFEEIWDAMIGAEGKAKLVRPNQATVMVGASNLLDSTKDTYEEHRNRPPNRTTSTSLTRPHKRFSMSF